MSSGASSGISAARRASGDEGFGGAEPTPGTGAAVGACTCVCVCVGCVSVLSEGGIIWSEPARSTPDSSGRPNACCASAIGDREADRRRPIGLESSASARESVGVDYIGGQVLATAPSWAVASTVPRLAIKTPNKIPTAHNSRYGYDTLLLHSEFSESRLGVWAATGLATGT